ncbi:hypothetical protein ACIRLA_22075 [Streptomyces sp. NPDC102364]|uniref:hypothetical protein n=1 Tax=Streptomyces sp. NPDC102364 TaxID=3366161 RepID=UPI00380E977B
MTDDNIINFPRIGFALPSGGGQAPPPPPAQPPTVGRPTRQSPLQIAAGATANPPAVRQGGSASATFRSPPPENTSARLGALSMAAILAVSVAALRGTVMVLQDRRQRRMQRDLEQAPFRAARLKNQLAMEQARHAVQEAVAKSALDRQQARDKHANAMQNIGDKSAEQRAKSGAKNSKVPSSHEFGRKTLGDRSSGGGGKGKGPGRGSGAKGSGGDKGLGAGKSGAKNSPKGRGSGKGPSSGTGSGGGSKGRGSGGGLKKNGAGRSGTGSKKNASGSGGGKNLSGGKSDKKSSTGKGGGKSPRRLSQGGSSGALKKKSPAGDDSSSKKTRSPAQERARRRQDRRDAGQNARLKRRADRQAAGLKGQAKDQKAARDLKYGGKQARQEAKGRIRSARSEAREGRKEQVRQGKFDAKQRRRAERADAKRNKKEQAAAAGADRTKLWDALKDDTANAARDRWVKRDGVPPLWKNDKKRDKKAKQPKDAKPKADKSGPGRGERWRRARDRARNARTSGGPWAEDERFGGTGPTGGPFATDGPGDSRTRRSPFENAGQAGGTTWTVEREDHVGAQANRWEPGAIDEARQALPADGPAALPTAPEPQFARPGTSRPRPMPPTPAPPTPAQETAPMNAPSPAAPSRGRAMDPQHATEITLDDSVDAGVKLKNDGLKTHQQANVLARRARKLRDVLRNFAEHLAHQNNLIGPLFSGAMESLGESMDVLARMADEMERESFLAGERAEGAANRLEDAYRPISQATADAGLSTPSAPAHNET